MNIMEMELVNLMSLQDIKEVVRLLSLYSSNSVDRQELAERLLGLNQQTGDSLFGLEKVERNSKITSQTKGILNTYFKCLSMRLED